MAYPLTGTLKKSVSVLKTLVEIKGFFLFFFLKKIVSSSFQAKERKYMVFDLESGDQGSAAGSVPGVADFE